MKMIKLTCLLSLLDFILGRETKFRDVVKSIKIYNESQHCDRSRPLHK